MSYKVMKKQGERESGFGASKHTTIPSVNVFRRKVFMRLLDECRRERPHINAFQICQGVWAKFSKTHQKSPSHKNNNVQNCSSPVRAHSMEEVKSSERDADRESNLVKNKKLQAGSRVLNLVCDGLKFCFYFVIFFAAIYCMVMLHKPTQALVSRNTQDFIYPIMRFLRLVSLSYVKDHPEVTKLYEDSCLIPNPYFTIVDLDCWPCEASRSIIDLTGFSNFSSSYHDSGIPFIVKDAVQTEISIQDVRTIAYEDDEFLSELFQNSGISDLSKFKLEFETGPHFVLNKETFHVSWKINRAKNVRMLRKYFSKPYFIPNTAEVSVQHFLFVEHSSSPPYTLPVTEFANVFVTQSSGTRFIILVPTEWCQEQCKILSVVLRPKDVLFYNWLFWKPKSAPVDSSSSNLSVTYIGSFY